MTLPKIAITMGDPGGVGPEIIVKALSRPEVREMCSPIVVGDARRLRAAAELCGLNISIAPLATIEQWLPGDEIAVIDLGLVPEDLPWGTLSPVAGEAAYRYVECACELALSGWVDAICTGPLNKEAINAAGHRFPGHTELLAALCGVPEVSMMLSAGSLNVIHVTTHQGLIDAIESIDVGLVERTIERGWLAMTTSGMVDPRIAVCAINPHAGEHGLFGRGEEETKIEPAVRRVRSRGIQAEGPLPADTAFFRAARGDFELVVAMYHDQGHAPIKVLGLDVGVNVTVGLPVIRTSVDHGTAFDIAGTGRAEPGSMIEAIRLASVFATDHDARTRSYEAQR